MTAQIDCSQDERTVLVDREGHGSAARPLMDGLAPPCIEKLEEHMVYAGRQPPPVNTFDLSLNPLIGGAQPLLVEVARLKHTTQPGEDLLALKERLSRLLEAFKAHASRHGAERSHIEAAHYVLCTVADEAVSTTSWGSESEWSRMNLLSTFHKETFGGESFFRMLENYSKDPVRHLPILELMYLCLALDFRGKYGVDGNRSMEVAVLRDALYRQIRQLRGDVSCDLSPQREGDHRSRRAVVRIVPAWMVLLFTLVCLASMYSGFAWVLGTQRDGVLQPYQPIDIAAPTAGQAVK